MRWIWLEPNFWGFCDWVSRNPVKISLKIWLEPNHFGEVFAKSKFWWGFQKPRHNLVGLGGFNHIGTIGPFYFCWLNFFSLYNCDWVFRNPVIFQSLDWLGGSWLIIWRFLKTGIFGFTSRATNYCEFCFKYGNMIGWWFRVKSYFRRWVVLKISCLTQTPVLAGRPGTWMAILGPWWKQPKPSIGKGSALCSRPHGINLLFPNGVRCS